MPKRVDHEAQRAHIRAAALRVLAREGTLSGGLAAVAAEAGMQRAALYHYYRDREGLLDDVAGALFREEEAASANALAGGGSVLERVYALVTTVTGRFAAWAEVGGALLEIWGREHARVGALIAELRGALTALFAEGQALGEVTRAERPEALATLVIALIDGMMLQILVDPHRVPDPAQLQASLTRAVRRLITEEADHV